MERTEVIAALGPTNTGKTYRALARMREHETGMIGLPLRLLAREVYDTLVADLGESEVALITGEEKIIPLAPRYWVCTVEAMPVDREVDFLAVDEIQLAGHRERGHVFTDRLLHARGLKETWFMGSDSLVPLVQRLVPTARIMRFPRLSRLRCEGSYTLASLPKRSAVVAFSVPRVYEIAERIRAKRGGVAIVLGALSPRARNAQVQMYQDGEVDYLVATDAIGLGLNLNIDRVAFADTRKFDGRQERALDLGELAQIAGRAGRYQSDGAFGTLAPRRPLALSLSTAIEEHVVVPQRSAFFRNNDLDFSSPRALVESLRMTPRIAGLHLPPEATDVEVLNLQLKDKRILARVTDESSLRILWHVCQIPDYRKLLIDEHARLTGEIFRKIRDEGSLSDEFLRGKILRLREHSGDIDAIVGRIASVRTWAYVSYRPAWVSGQDWQAQTREIDDALSDELHRALVERFVTSTRRGASKQRAQQKTDRSLSSQLARLQQRLDGSEEEVNSTLSERLLNADGLELHLSSQGDLSFEGKRVASFGRGRKLAEPRVRFHFEELELPIGTQRRLEEQLRAAARKRVSFLFQSFEPLGEGVEGEDGASLQGLGYQLREGLGSLRRQQLQSLLRVLKAEGRAALRASKLIFGRRHVYSNEGLTREHISIRMALLAASTGLKPPQDWSPSGSFVLQPGTSLAKFTPADLELVGYELLGRRAVRLDIVEGIVTLASKKERREWQPVIMESLACSPDEARQVLRQLGLGGAARRRRRRTSGSRRA